MQTYQLFVEDRNYISFAVQTIETCKQVDHNTKWFSSFNPVNSKMFSKDVFTIADDTGLVKIIHSHIRSNKEIAGVLLLENNKTFGRTSNKKRLLYKCIPDDKHLPNFLIPYEMNIGFSKVFKNKFVIFRFDHWNDKHPQGILVETLGDVDNLETFYEYQLYCKSLHISITEFNNKTREQLNHKTATEYVSQIMSNPRFIIEDRRKTHTIFTIDPRGSLDLDDGFSISSQGGNKWRISIYIANVYFWLETFGLWKSFSKRVSTIYLPERRRPMIPTILSDTLCSLQQGHDRFAFEMSFLVDAQTGILDETSITFTNVLINVATNYAYEDPKMIAKDENYQKLFAISQLMDKSVENSHDVVSHWMIYMNKLCGEHMARNKFGIFRSSIYLHKNRPCLLEDYLGEDSKRVITNWNNITGQYIAFDANENFEHEAMQTKTYVHITSPIRRLVDLLNQMWMFENIGLIRGLSPDASSFVRGWISNMDYINTSMRSIRKIQTDCEVMCRCFTDKSIMDREHRGVVFDKIRIDSVFSYMVYLEEIRLLTRITCPNDLQNHSYVNFKIYLFEDENTMRRKIRLSIVPHVQVESN